jgi:ABC-type multidrug transport system fused ATPase/permease subunit
MSHWRICIRNLSYTYPGALKPALDNINFTIEAGQSFAIVGVNGSGKTTLSMILLRLIDFNGELEINGIDIRRYKPSEYHQHITGVLQNFSKWNSTVHENVGLGQIEWIEDPSKVGQALKLAEAETVVASLPSGVRTVLEPPGFEGLVYPGSMNARYPSLHHGLSGGEVRSNINPTRAMFLNER